MKTFLTTLLSLAALLSLSCSGDDRSGEMPYAPTLRIDQPVIEGHSVILRATVLSSPNSSLVACGFFVGNDLQEEELKCDTPSTSFSFQIDSLGTGSHYAVAYAKNGIAQTTSDTLLFTIQP